MNGLVGAIGSCDAILCRHGTFAPSGRQESSGEPCRPCDGYIKNPLMGHVVCKAIDTERGVLELLFARCGGLSWKRRKNWFGDGPICNWEGVTCATSNESDKGVVDINLSDNNMTGILPVLIFSLPELVELKIRNNPDLIARIDGIPDNSIRLQKLYMANIRVESLRSLSRLSSLEELEFSGLTGTIPDELFSLNKIESLMLGDNFFIGTLPSTLGTLTTLQKLHIPWSDLHGPIAPTIGRLSLLRELGE